MGVNTSFLLIFRTVCLVMISNHILLFNAFSCPIVTSPGWWIKYLEAAESHATWHFTEHSLPMWYLQHTMPSTVFVKSSLFGASYHETGEVCAALVGKTKFWIYFALCYMTSFIKVPIEAVKMGGEEPPPLESFQLTPLTSLKRCLWNITVKVLVVKKKERWMLQKRVFVMVKKEAKRI